MIPSSDSRNTIKNKGNYTPDFYLSCVAAMQPCAFPTQFQRQLEGRAVSRPRSRQAWIRAFHDSAATQRGPPKRIARGGNEPRMQSKMQASLIPYSALRIGIGQDFDPNKKSLQNRVSQALEVMAERGGFEPPVPFRSTQHFQCCVLNQARPPLRGTVSRLVRVAYAITIQCARAKLIFLRFRMSI